MTAERSASADHDVAVVGGSIADCTVAALLGRAGVRLALLKRRPRAVEDNVHSSCRAFPARAATLTRGHATSGRARWWTTTGL
jgi:2-polyprenyl-6-methoxyphenol hydroxylase-like FAD-dependent oxidoreductase